MNEDDYKEVLDLAHMVEALYSKFQKVKEPDVVDLVVTLFLGDATGSLKRAVLASRSR